MKVLFCFYGPNGLGGPVTWARRMLPRLIHHGIDVIAVPYHTTAGECLIVSDLLAAGVPVRVVNATDLSPGDGVQLILSAIVEEKPAVIVADHVLPALITGAWTKRYGVPTVMVLRSDDTWYRHLQEMFLAGSERHRVNKIVAVSRELEAAARSKAPPGLEIMQCPSCSTIPTSRACFRDNQFHVVYLGRLDEEQKRVRELLQELIALSKIMPEFSAALYGDGPLKDEVIQTLHTEKNHHIFYGGRLLLEEIFPHLLEAQALVLFSAYEGLSSAIQEAMACGLPIISRRTASGTDGVLIHGVNAWVLESDSELKEAVSHLAHSQSDWQGLANGARAFAEEHFDIEKATIRWVDLLTRTADGQDWPIETMLKTDDGQNLYIDYLSCKSDLDVYEAATLIESAHAWSANIECFFRNPKKAWEERCYILYRGMENGILAAELTVTYARILAEEAEMTELSTFEERYRIASLWQKAGDFSRAQAEFFSLAERVAPNELKAGCFFHLAEMAASQGQADNALSLTRTCLSILPHHKAAAALFHHILTTLQFRP